MSFLKTTVSTFDAIPETVKAAPPITVAVGKFVFGFSLPEWAAILTIAYTMLLIFEKLVKWYRFGVGSEKPSK